MSRAGFVNHLERCTGCGACRLACRFENRLGSRAWRSVWSFNGERWPQLRSYNLSLACNHCCEAPCMAACPVGAYSRDPHSDGVLLDSTRCMGCRYCGWVCPYGAPRFDAAHGVMEKCNFCVERTRQGQVPACVEACPVSALEVAAEPVGEDPVVAGLPRPGLGAQLEIPARSRGVQPPEISPPVPVAKLDLAPAGALSLARLSAEWSLLAFSLLATLLVSWQLASLLGGPRVHGPSFILLGFLAMGVGAFHLGAPSRAWRAIVNWRSSWISREILAFSTFLALAGGHLAMNSEQQPWAAWAAAGAGVAALAAMDMVYRVRGQRVSAMPHSAMASLSLVLWLGVLADLPVLTAAAMGLKLVLYALRCGRQAPPPVLLLLLRLGVGMGAPLALWASGSGGDQLLVLGCLLVGEIVDRAQLYGELRFLDPELQISRDLAALLKAPPELCDREAP